MKATKSKDGETELPLLKEWTKETLTQSDWDFTALCNDLARVDSQLPEQESLGLIHRAFNWEIERELGSGKGPFDLKKELAKPRPQLANPRESKIVLQRDNNETVDVDIEPPLWLHKQPRMNPLNPQEVIIQGVSSFVERLRQQSSPLTIFLMSKLSDVTRNRVLKIPPLVMGRRGDSDALIRLYNSLQREVNEIIKSGSIYEKPRFAGVTLSGETKALLESEPTGEDLVRLNRLLLEDAFPNEIPKGPRQTHPLNEWHLGALTDFLTPDTFSASRGSNDICALEIPWTEDEDYVVEAFRLWLQEHRGRHVGKEGAGRPHEWRWQFTNLAIHRLVAAGYEQGEVLKIVGSMSTSTYNRAIPFIKQEIKRQFGNSRAQERLLTKKPLKVSRHDFLKQ